MVLGRLLGARRECLRSRRKANRASAACRHRRQRPCASDVKDHSRAGAGCARARPRARVIELRSLAHPGRTARAKMKLARATLGGARTLPAGLASSPIGRVSRRLAPTCSLRPGVWTRGFCCRRAPGPFRLEDVDPAVWTRRSRSTVQGDVDALLSADGVRPCSSARLSDRRGPGLPSSAAIWPRGATPSNESKPARTGVSYKLKFGAGVEGLRLVENTLELLERARRAARRAASSRRTSSGPTVRVRTRRWQLRAARWTRALPRRGAVL